MNTTLPATAAPAIARVDDPAADYATLRRHLGADIAIVDRLLHSIASRTANVAQILTFNAAAWTDLAHDNGDEDAATMHRLEGRAGALAWVRDEIGVLTGSGLGRAARIPAFSDPACWTDQVPPDADESEDDPWEAQRLARADDAWDRREIEEFHGQGAEQREEGARQ